MDDDGKREAIGVLRTWLCRLRNVKTVVVQGLPESDANTIKERWQSSEPLENTPLTDMYKILEKHAEAIGLCEQNLRRALLACEADNMECFKDP